MRKFNAYIPPQAEDVEFDPSNCEAITSDDVQGAIEDLCEKVDTSASPGFTFGRSGNITANTWLLNDTVPSNKAGRTIFLNNATLESVFVSNESPNTFDLEIWEHNGTTFNLLTTVSISAARNATFSAGSLSLTTGYELAVKVVNGSGKNITAGLLLSGDLP